MSRPRNQVQRNLVTHIRGMVRLIVHGLTYSRRQMKWTPRQLCQSRPQILSCAIQMAIELSALHALLMAATKIELLSILNWSHEG